MKKNENLIISLTLVLVLDLSFGLYISQEKATKVINNTFVIVCKDEAGETVKWSGPKGPLSMKTHPKVQVASYGTQIIFNGTTLNDAGTYKCTSPKETKEFVLTIEAPLKFMDTSPEQIGNEGDNVTLRCEVESGRATWSIDGNDPTAPKYQVMGDGLLIINVTRYDSETNFVCKAVQQSTGTVEERKINLIVNHRPTWSYNYPVYAQQNQAWGYMGGTTNLTCQVEAVPPPTIEWKKIDRNNKERNVPDTAKVIKVSNHTSILQVYVTKSSLGTYKCKVRNRMGKLEKHITLEEGTKPQPPKFIELHGENSNLLDLGIHAADLSEQEIAAGMEPKWYNVEYRKANIDEEWSNRDFNISEDNSYPLLDLHHDTEYEVRAASRNLAGLSDYTNSSFFKTLPSSADCVHHIISPIYYLILAFIIPIYYSTV